MARSFSSDYETGTPFWRIFFAVLLAMCAYGLLKLAIVSLMARAAVEEATKQLQTIQQTAPQPRPAARYEAAPRRAVQPELPDYPGPLTAKRKGLQFACIGGYVSKRLPDGWDQSRNRCYASSP